VIAPPRLARRVLAAALPETHRAVVLADLDEEFAERIASQRSPSAASWWYWRQVLASLPGALRMRVRFQTADLARDLRHGARMLRRKPVFAATAMLTLTIGIGATSAVLTLSTAVLVRPLPYANVNELVAVMEFDREHDSTSGNLSWPDFLDYQRANQTLSAMAAYTGGSRTLSVPGVSPERVPGASVTGNFFDVLGVRPILGRTLNDADVPASAPPVVVLTYASWMKRFGGDPAAIGRTLTLNGISTTVVGVLPREFEFSPRGQAELWTPVHPTKNQMERKFYHWMDALGRLKPGVSIAQASEDFNRIAAGFAPLDPRAHQHTGVRMPPIRTRMVGDAKSPLLILSGASLLVLLVACANIAALLLAQAGARTQEMAVRNVMGAGRARLLRQLLAENLAFAVPGGIFGVIAGQWMLRGLVASMPPVQRVTLPHVATLSLDGTALAISLVLTISASLLFGLVPALRAIRTERLQSTRGVAGAGARELRLQSTFVVVQVALALVLLAGSGLIGQSLRRLLDVSPGFRTDHLLTMSVALPADRYKDPAAIGQFQTDLLLRMAGSPGIAGATLIDQLPLTGGGNTGGFTVVGDPRAKETITLVRSAASNYFDVMGVKLEAGRKFAPGDTAASTQVVMVNRALADRAFGGTREALGQRIQFPFMPGQLMEIVGIVGNEQFDALDRGMQPVLYFAQSQGSYPSFSLVLRTTGDPAAAVPSAVAEVGRLDPSVTLSSRLTMDQIMNSSEAVFRRRSVLTLIGGFAIATLILAAIGLYGVLAQVVAERTREIGVRLALGAGRSAIFASVIRRGLTPVAIGLALGLGGSLLSGRLLAGLLFGTTSKDPMVLAVSLVLITVVALAACVIPARRALRVNPVDALRG
jgi:putative ABC transport system permease protein